MGAAVARWIASFAQAPVEPVPMGIRRLGDLQRTVPDLRDVRVRPSSKRVRVVGALALSTLLGIGLATFLSDPTPASETIRVRLTSDCDGPITDWLLSLPDEQTFFFENAQAQLIVSADPAIRFHVYYALDASRRGLEASLRRRGWKDDGRVHWHEAPRQGWPWMRDMFLTASTPTGESVALLHHPDHDWGRKDKWSQADLRLLVSRLPRARCVGTTARLEGGSVVIDESTVLASGDFISAALARKEAPSASELLARHRELWGRPIEVIPTQAAHISGHCDLLMMPAGDKRMILASVELGAKLLESIGPDERAGFRAACKRITAVLPEDHPLRKLSNLDLPADMVWHGQQPALHRAYDEIRRRLEKLGYECFEVPLLEFPYADHEQPITFSYANVVIDQREGARTVYLPTYGLPTVDRHAVKVWRSLGFRVHRIDCLAPGLWGGGVHCLSQVFRR